MKTRRAWLAIAATLAVLPRVSNGQTTGSAAVGGRVSDASGAAVIGAIVKLTDPSRSLARDTTSNDAGDYVFPSIPAGTYSLRVTKPDFDVYEVKSFDVAVAQRATINVELKVGQVTTIVSVAASAETVLLETESNALGTVVDSSRVESLPLNGRDFLQLASLSAGSSVAPDQQTGHPARFLNVAGAIANTVGYMVDGIATRGSRQGDSQLDLSIASIDQFKVQESFFMPSQGPNPALVNVVSKGGTNQFHGQVFEFLRNDVLDSRNFFAPTAENLHRNQFGGAIGGPIIKNRLWFYGNYEGLRQIDQFSSRAYDPTAAMFSGNFAGAGAAIYDPASFSAQTGTRQPFPNGVIPSNRINPVAANLLKYYLPGASLAQKPSNVFGNPRNTLYDDQGGLRIDGSITDRQTVFGRFVHENSPAVAPGLEPYSGLYFPEITDLAVLQHTFTISPSLVNVARVGFVRNQVTQSNEGQALGHILGQIGIQNTFDDRGITAISVQGFNSFGRANGDVGNIDNNYQLDEGLTYNHGTHQFEFGNSIRYRRTAQQNANANALGTLAFQSTFTAQLVPNSLGQLVPQVGTGNGFADLLMGIPTNSSMQGLPRINYHFIQFMPYFQDTWKVTRNFTLNYGISWFKATIPDPQGSARMLAHDFNPVTGLLEFAALGQVDPRVATSSNRDFTPRLGFAWSPSALRNTVIRAGAGVYYDDINWVELQADMVGPPFNVPFQVNNGTTAPVPTYVLGQNLFPPAVLPPLDQNFAQNLPPGTASFALKYHGTDPYSTQWNFSIQHTFGNDDLVEIDYVGSSSHNQTNGMDQDECRPTADLRCDPATKLYPRYASLITASYDGNASYEGLIAKFHHRISAGLNFRAEYTYSKTLIDTAEGSPFLSQYSSCRACDKAPATFDVQNRFVASTIWDIPYGRGQRFGTNAPRALDFLAGGWVLTGITTFATGIPVYVSEPNQTGTNTAFLNRPNRICDGRSSALSGNLRGDGLVDFQTSCFVPSAPGFFGNSGSNVLRAPGLNNWDVGIQKIFTLREQTRLEFRGELFNAFNHAQFGAPIANTGNLNFGLVTTANPPRLVQLGLKLFW